MDVLSGVRVDFKLFFQGIESALILPKALKTLKINYFENHFGFFFSKQPRSHSVEGIY